MWELAWPAGAQPVWLWLVMARNKTVQQKLLPTAAAESIPQQVPPREASDSLACESQRQSKVIGNERKTGGGTVGKGISLYLVCWKDQTALCFCSVLKYILS